MGVGDHDRGISYKMESLYGVSWTLNSKHHHYPEALKWGWGDHDRGISYKMESLYGVSWTFNSEHHRYLVVYANLP